MSDLRVALCGVGDVGHYAIRGVLSRSDMTLCGVQTFSSDKAGSDAAELIGWEPCGTLLTTSLQEVLSQRPDALVYCGKSRSYEPVLPYLRAGIDVAYLGIPELLHPPSCPAGDSCAHRGGRVGRRRVDHVRRHRSGFLHPVAAVRAVGGQRTNRSPDHL